MDRKSDSGSVGVILVTLLVNLLIALLMTPDQ